MPDHTCALASSRPAVTGNPLMLRSDSELLPMVRRQGVRRRLAFSELIRRHRRWLVKHCAFRLGNRDDAQDVVQQVMLRAWRAIDRFEGRAAFRSWLYAIADNECRRFAIKRTRYVQAEHMEGLINLYDDGTRTSDIEGYGCGQAVTVALRNVSDKAREVLLLRFFQDCSLEEMSASLAISLSATKMRLYRSMEQFRIEYLHVVGVRTAQAR
jgi:RNA polymerase sigma-70 factor (ECF subfamily)